LKKGGNEKDKGSLEKRGLKKKKNVTGERYNKKGQILLTRRVGEDKKKVKGRKKTEWTKREGRYA